METVGIMATVVAAAGVLVGGAMLIRSLPDIAHNPRLRKM